VSDTYEPDLCYLLRAFSRADWLDEQLLTAYVGRVHRRMHAFQLDDVAALLEALANPRLRDEACLRRALVQLSLLTDPGAAGGGKVSARAHPERPAGGGDAEGAAARVARALEA
ncbi:unnamed protein product, partial [Prorocentrum cordatum]